MQPEKLGERARPEPRVAPIESLLDSLDPARLLDLRCEIDSRLPATSLADLDLEKELVVQYAVIRQLQTDTLRDEDTPANQKAQTANACAATLAQLTKMQTEQYTSERFKAIESHLVKTLKTWPEEMTKEFFAAYEAMSE